MVLICLLVLVGMLLSAYFSGTETGFYRASRVRLLLDGLDGDLISRLLLMLTNNPTLFVATTLIGNNLANYLVSLGIVLATERIVTGDSMVFQLAAPVVLAPLIFVYGELLPKNLFYHVPNRLLRLGAAPFFGFAILFLPLAMVLWTFGQLLRRLLGESPERVHLMLAQKELARVFEEGHQAGILGPSQRDLANGLFSVAKTPVTQFLIPPARIVSIRIGMTAQDVFRLAHRQRTGILSVESDQKPRRLVGYVRVVDLHLGKGNWTNQIRPLLEIRISQTLVGALMQMQDQREPMARVVGPDGETSGLLSARHLIEALFRGEK